MRLDVTSALCPDPTYRGRSVCPYLATLAPRIEAEILGGVEPLAIQFKAIETRATYNLPENHVPGPHDCNLFTDPEYLWSVTSEDGGALRPRRIPHPVRGGSINPGFQRGPLATFVFGAGTYTVTLTVRGWNGTELVTATTSTIVRPKLVQVSLGGATGGTYRIAIDGQYSEPIAWDASPKAMVEAVAAIPSVGAGNVENLVGANEPWLITVGANGPIGTMHAADPHRQFWLRGKYLGLDPAVTLDDANLTGKTGTPAAKTMRAGGQTSTIAVQSLAQSGWTNHYFDPENGSDFNDGLTEQTPKKTPSWTSNRILRMKAGTTHVLGQTGLPQKNFRMLPYGSGPAPILKATLKEPNGQTTGLMFGWSVAAGTSGVDNGNVVFDGIVFDGSGECVSGVFCQLRNDASANPHGSFYDFALIDCTVRNHRGFGISRDYGGYTRNKRHSTYWGVHFDRRVSGSNGTFGGGDSESVIGCQFDGGQGHYVLDHDMYPGIFDCHIFQHCSSSSAPSLNFFLNANGPDSWPGRYVVVDGCDVTGKQSGLDCSSGGAGQHTGGIKDYLITDCNIHSGNLPSRAALNGAGVYYGIYGTHGQGRITVRDCYFWGNTDADIWNGHPNSVLHIYRNKFHRPPRSSIKIGSNHGIMCYNEFVCAGSSSRPFEGAFATDGARWISDKNTFWAPAGLSFLDGGITPRSLAQWRSMTGNDLNSVQYNTASPQFPDPANGDFGQRDTPLPSPTVNRWLVLPGVGEARRVYSLPTPGG